MRRRSSSIFVTCGVLVALAIAGCSSDDKPAPSPPPAPTTQAPVKPPLQKQMSSAKPASAASPTGDFASRKDPFKPFIQPKAEKPAPGKLRGEGALPIQNYEVEQFKVSGIIVGLKENKALLVDPTGKGYVVKEGMNIGPNNGVITKITPSHLEVAERHRDDTGKVTRRTVRLSLPKKN